ncbi:hypothetical protein MLD38_020865 [Melastoma candidum]|uniref:Uncharacterized protein n=3 Tax=Melastoma candidum TaxID=119954 RepID=A0ACB9QET2_9MYRT|nr:hypothetical protein MLD38_020859 [Melastoma candidum]KAI4364821.1 hypothetical protein MLD38_020862 [Melastoma candidum]KAI4364825.1 hypothetical protein MLD38_020865 [Melastoma candidum]
MEQSKATTSSNVWIRHPRGSRKDFLDFDFPKKNTFTLSRGCVLPCYHKHNENDRHILGASDSPQLNTVTDLTLASAHNLVIIYDRQQALGLEIADLRKDIQNLEQVKLQQDLKQLKEQVSSLALSFAEVSAKLLRVAEHATALASAPKPEETKVLFIAESLEQRVQELEQLLKATAALIPS